MYRGVEQLVAHRAHNPKVVGSSPTSATIEIPCTHCVCKGFLLFSLTEVVGIYWAFYRLIPPFTPLYRVICSKIAVDFAELQTLSFTCVSKSFTTLPSAICGLYVPAIVCSKAVERLSATLSKTSLTTCV